MSRKSLVPGVVPIPWFAIASAQQEPLTNDSVIKMVKAGPSEDVILRMVKSQPAKYTVTPEELISLKSAGVPDRVVAAMVEKNAAGGAQTCGATPAIEATAPDVWSMLDFECQT